MPARSAFWCIDCETDPFKEGRIPAPFLWGVYNGETEEYEEFPTSQEMLTFLNTAQAQLVYAHNGGKFDYHFLRDEINTDENIMVVSGRLAKFRIGDIEFRDSINLLVNPLRAFAKEEIDYAKLEAEVRHLHMDEIKRYLRSDCVNLWTTLKAYFDRYGRGLTQAGASFRYWKKNYGTGFIAQQRGQAELYRPFYYGGRVECFATGHAKQNFDVIDINSAYPYAMLSRHPFEPEGVLRTTLPPGDELERTFIRLDAVAKGCFPLRDVEDGSLQFPWDEKKVREYFVTGWELKAALELNLVKIFNVVDVHYFSHTVDFVQYVNHFYDERKAAKIRGDKVQDVFAKLFMNSLYGKFAADPNKYHEYLIATDDSFLDHVEEGYHCSAPWSRPRAGLVHGEEGQDNKYLMARPLPEEKHRYYNVATAASITGFVRAHLLKALHASSGVLYCDTDSIAARRTEGVPLSGNLGDWKLEMRCNEYAIAGKKLYAFKNAELDEWKVACKGVDLTAAQIVQVARGKRISYSPEVPTFSIHKSSPQFVGREICMTAKEVVKTFAEH